MTQTLFPPTPQAPLDHIRWRRLPDTAPRRTRPNRSGERPPLRSDPAEHGEALAAELSGLLEQRDEARRQTGIDPARLRVLELDFLNAAQRDLLEKLGLQILAEDEVKERVDPPYYRIELRFQTADTAVAFSAAEHTDRGVTAIDPVRESSGGRDLRRLAVRFANRPDAVAFQRDAGAAEAAGYAPSSLVRIEVVLRYRLLAQFPNQATIDVFQQELEPVMHFQS